MPKHHDIFEINADQAQASHPMVPKHSTRVYLHHKPRYLTQILAALAISLGPFSAGLGKGYSSPAIASLHSLHIAPNIEVSEQEASWIASLSLGGAFFGALFGGIAMKFGRRSVLLASAPPLSLSWVGTYLATDTRTMFVTSFVGGFCCAIILTVSQVYIVEISEPEIRGRLSAVLKIVNQTGVLLSFAVGAVLNWRQLAFVVALAPAAFFAAVLALPETPSYLMLSGKHEEAKRSLRWLRADTDILHELHSLRNNILVMQTSTPHNSAPSATGYVGTNTLGPHTSSYPFYGGQSGLHGGQVSSAGGPTRLGGAGPLLHTSRAGATLSALFTKPALVCCALVFFQRFSGTNAFNFYAVTTLSQTLINMNPHSGAVAVALVQLIASLFSGILVDTAGRLPLLIASSVFMSISLAGFGSFCYYREHRRQFPSEVMSAVSGDSSGSGLDPDWIPLLCVLIFHIAFSLGISPISSLLIGELFPLEIRGLGSSLSMAFSYLCAFLVVKSFVDFKQMFAMSGTYWLYACISLSGLCFIVCCVPETKGKDLDEMKG
uniref:Facilitated trehalose transporter Tret1 n=2 Tax=Cacopsylla melanoneura TaxID=428564 RepID=A0A8D8RC64_9HEMI